MLLVLSDWRWLLSGPLVGTFFLETSNFVLYIGIICMSCKHSMHRLLTFPLYLLAGNSKNNTLADKAHLFIGSLRTPQTLLCVEIVNEHIIVAVVSEYSHYAEGCLYQLITHLVQSDNQELTKKFISNCMYCTLQSG